MDVSDRLPNVAARARCARCNVAFDCGGATRPFQCWCANLPALPEQRQPGAPRPAHCLCPACYAEALAAAGCRSAGDPSMPCTARATTFPSEP